MIVITKLRLPEGRYSTCGIIHQLSPNAKNTITSTVASFNKTLRCRKRLTPTTASTNKRAPPSIKAIGPCILARLAAGFGPSFGPPCGAAF